MHMLQQTVGVADVQAAIKCLQFGLINKIFGRKHTMLGRRWSKIPILSTW